MANANTTTPDLTAPNPRFDQDDPGANPPGVYKWPVCGFDEGHDEFVCGTHDCKCQANDLDMRREAHANWPKG
jgi:hypothetical protein